MDYTFFQDNYVWIIVIAVIVVMTIIGYIADKTKFGEKKEKIEKVKPIKKTEENQEPVVEESPMDNFMTEEPIEQEVAFNNDMEANFEMPTNEEVGFETFEPVASLPEDSQNEMMNFEMPMETVEEQNEEVLPETQEVENLSEVSEESENMPVEENMNQETTNEETLNQEVPTEESVEDNFKLPSIDKLNQEIAEVEEDEDVWKF